MKQYRKQRAANGERESKMLSFRADRQTIDILSHAPNKGRLINDLVQKWWKRNQKNFEDNDTPPEENSIEEYFT